MEYNLGLVFQAIALYLTGYVCGYFSIELFELIQKYKKQKLNKEIPSSNPELFPDVRKLIASQAQISNLRAEKVHIGLVSEPSILKEYMCQLQAKEEREINNTVRPLINVETENEAYQEYLCRQQIKNMKQVITNDSPRT